MSKEAGRNFFLYGAGGHAKVIVDICIETGIDSKRIGIIDDNNAKVHTLFYREIPILGGLDYLLEYKSQILKCIVAIGDNHIRGGIYTKLCTKLSTELFAPLISKLSHVSSTVAIGNNTVIMPGVIINSDTVISSNCIVNTGSNVDHDCLIGEHVHIAPAASLSGGVKIGKYSLIGNNATIIPNISIGRNCIIGAGAVVINDIPDNSVAVGVPARIIKKNSE